MAYGGEATSFSFLTMLKESHDSPYAGHVGVTKTRSNIQRYFTWRILSAEDAADVQHCPSCQRQRSASNRPTGLLQPAEVWHTLTIDYATGLPKTATGNTAIVVFVNKLAEYGYLLTSSKEGSAVDWVNKYLDHAMACQRN